MDFCYSFINSPFLRKKDLKIEEAYSERLDDYILKTALKKKGLAFPKNNNEIAMLSKFFESLFFNYQNDGSLAFLNARPFQLVFFTKTFMQGDLEFLFTWSLTVKKATMTRQDWEDSVGLKPLECCKSNFGEKWSINAEPSLEAKKEEKLVEDSCCFPGSFTDIRLESSIYFLSDESEHEYEALKEMQFTKFVRFVPILKTFKEPVPLFHYGFTTKHYTPNCKALFQELIFHRNVEFFFESVFSSMLKQQEELMGFNFQGLKLKSLRHELLFFYLNFVEE